jgi:NSS family neurotransmitter:Na+ symporter
LAILLIYSIQQDGFLKAVDFMFYPHVEKFNSNSLIVAVGHAFFTLSVGMVTILTYAASLNKEVNVVKTSVTIVIMDTLIAIVAGLIIFTITFSAAQEPSQGPGLVFITLPAIFYKMGSIGVVVALLFFIALVFAAITSAVSILEPTVMYLVEKKNMTRKKATYSLSVIFYILGVVALLSNITQFEEALTFGSKNLFSWFDFVTSAILMPLGGILVALFVGYVMDKNILRKALVPYIGETMYALWLFIIRIIAPAAIFILMLKEIGIISF